MPQKTERLVWRSDDGGVTWTYVQRYAGSSARWNIESQLQRYPNRRFRIVTYVMGVDDSFVQSVEELGV